MEREEGLTVSQPHCKEKPLFPEPALNFFAKLVCTMHLDPGNKPGMNETRKSYPSDGNPWLQDAPASLAFNRARASSGNWIESSSSSHAQACVKSKKVPSNCAS